MVDIRDVPLPAGVTLAKELDTALADADVRVVVETIGGKGIAYQYTRRALEAGRHVVSSNKELVATHGDGADSAGRARRACGICMKRLWAAAFRCCSPFMNCCAPAPSRG